MSDPAVVALDRVTVMYGGHAALREVSTAFAPGAVGLLGPNGAGKSTLIKSLLGFVTPASGTMRVLGHDVATAAMTIRARVGYMPENDAHIPGMSAVSFVAYCGELAGLPPADAMQRAHEMLFYVGLGEARYRNVETYSTGMKQRIKLAQALVHDPDLVFLDEPTNGMDPNGRDQMLALIADLARNKGINVILSSHLLPDIETTCEHVIVLDKGQVAAAGPISGMTEARARVYELRVKAPAGLDAMFAAFKAQGIEWRGTQGDIILVVVPPTHTARDLFVLAGGAGVQVRHLRASVTTLDDVFARAVGDS